MLLIPRAQVRSFKAVVRRCLFEGCPRNDWPLLLIRNDGQKMVMESARGNVAVRHVRDSLGPPDEIAFRCSMLAEFEGRTTAPVRLEQVSFGKGAARWDEGGVPCEYPLDTVTPESVRPLPDVPEKLVSMPDGFLDALGEAALTTAEPSVRYALQQVQLGGKDGAIIATDGKQLLVQKGFPLPWSDSVLVPRLCLAGLPAVAGDATVKIGRTETHVVLQVNDWTFFLRIDDKARYPQVSDVLPRQSAITARWHLSAEDASRLVKILPSCPVTTSIRRQ